MPCKSDYMEANAMEIALSKVYCLMEELGGKAIDKNHWAGYHPRAYGQSRSPAELDNATGTLCAMLKQDFDAANYSLEMQLWWRNHQTSDKERMDREADERDRAELRVKALGKLTYEEKKALGLKEDE